MKNYLEYIDDYLSGSLAEPDLQDFMRQLNQDPLLQDEIMFHQEIMEGIEQYGKALFTLNAQSVEEELDIEGFFSNDDEKEIIQGIESIGKTEFESLVKDIDQELEQEQFYSAQSKDAPKKGRIIRLGNRRGLMAIAASLLILITAAVFFWPKSMDTEQLYISNFVPIPDPISEELRVEKGELGFAGNNDPLLALEATMGFYNERDCDAFIQTSESLLEEPALGHYRNRIYLLRGICFMVSNQFNLAESSLRRSNEMASWKYLLLLYIKTGNIDKAKQFYESLEEPSTELQMIYKQID
jgi:hypothetical protein